MLILGGEMTKALFAELLLLFLKTYLQDVNLKNYECEIAKVPRGKDAFALIGHMALRRMRSSR